MPGRSDGVEWKGRLVWQSASILIWAAAESIMMNLDQAAPCEVSWCGVDQVSSRFTYLAYRRAFRGVDFAVRNDCKGRSASLSDCEFIMVA